MEALSFKNQIIIATLLFLFVIFVIRALYKRKMTMEYSLMWIIVLFAALVVSSSNKIFNVISNILGAKYPIAAVALLGFIFIISMLIFFSLKISDLSNKIQEMARYIAFLEKENIQKKKL